MYNAQLCGMNSGLSICCADLVCVALIFSQSLSARSNGLSGIPVHLNKVSIFLIIIDLILITTQPWRIWSTIERACSEGAYSIAHYILGLYVVGNINAGREFHSSRRHAYAIYCQNIYYHKIYRCKIFRNYTQWLSSMWWSSHFRFWEGTPNPTTRQLCYLWDRRYRRRKHSNIYNRLW